MTAATETPPIKDSVTGTDQAAQAEGEALAAGGCDEDADPDAASLRGGDGLGVAAAAVASCDWEPDRLWECVADGGGLAACDRDAAWLREGVALDDGVAPCVAEVDEVLAWLGDGDGETLDDAVSVGVAVCVGLCA